MYKNADHSNPLNLPFDKAPAEGCFEKLAAIARTALGAPMAILSLIDADGRWTRIGVGVEPCSVPEANYKNSFCAHVVAHGETLFVEDALTDSRFNESALVTEAPYIRSYAGAPLQTEKGNFGTLCAFSHEASALKKENLTTLEMLAALAMETLADHARFKLHERRKDILRLTEELTGAGYGYFNLFNDSFFVSDRVRELQGIGPDTPRRTMDEALQAYHPQDREFVRYNLKRALESGKPFDIITRLLRPNGQIRLVHLNVEPEFLDNTRTVCGLFGVVRDITEEQQVKQRLAIAEKMATLGTMAAAITHEFNTPLNYITANFHLLRDKLSSSDGEQDTSTLDILEDIEVGITRLTNLSRDLLLFSRNDQPTDPSNSHADVRRAIEMAMRLGITHSRHTSLVEVDIPDEISMVKVLENHLVQITLNLIINATQAFEEEDGEDNKISISAHQTPDERIIIEVKDNGPGIPPDLLERIFDPFFTTKPHGEGCGLGLLICKQLAQENEGDISVTSVLGEGTTFQMTFQALPHLASSGETLGH